MKKILAAILSLALCTTMFTACGKKDEGTEVIEQTVAETVTEPEITTAETTVIETEAAKTVEHSYKSLDDFIDEAFELETETVEESLLSDYMSSNIGDNELYFDMETPDGSMQMLLAYKDSNMCVKAEGEGESIYIYVIDGIMYMLEAAEKTGFSMELDQGTLDSLTSEAMGGMDLEAATAQVDKSECVEVEIDGEDYTFENLEKVGALFYDDGEIYAIVNGDTSQKIRAFVVNEISGSIPEGILELPTDYEITDMSDLLSGLEDYYETEESDEPAKESEKVTADVDFATMDEFVKADFSKFEGTEYKAEDSLSAKILNIFTSDTLYVESAYEGTPMKIAISGGKVMLEGDFGDTGEILKFIFSDEKFYAISDAEKLVIVSSAEDIGTADELIEASKAVFSDVSIDNQVVVRTEVSIEGKKYIVETDSDKDSCLIFHENEELYAIVDDRVFSEWIVTDKIPAGTFDIPSDYEVLDTADYE